MATIFSSIIAGEIPSYRIAENDSFYAFLDINPMTKGHTLVVPKKETDYLFDLDDTLLADMMVFAKKVAKAIETAVPCKRVGVMVIGLEVPHAHIHLIPVKKEGDMSLSNQRLSLSKEEFEEIAGKIGSAFKSS
ncbi:MAG: HIT family protein [Proteiniphilum sp.]|nr:HIT family protein [Proteiniphilum sp.]